MKTILVVDDVDLELRLLRGYLQEAGYSVTTANSGEAALASVAQKKPDAIVTDLVMPDLSGLDFCRQLKKAPETADIPIVACTSKDREADKYWARKQGVSAYVVKPCTKDDLVKAVESVL